MATHNDLGQLGEDIAADFLREQGYDICVQNYRYLKSEIDIIARKSAILAIVEVKSRTNGFIEDLSDIITTKKIKRLAAAADHYIQTKDLDVEARFDIITVVKHQNDFAIEYFKNAFYHF